MTFDQYDTVKVKIMRTTKSSNRKYSPNAPANSHNLCKKECIVISIENLYFKHGAERKNFLCFSRLAAEALCWPHVPVISVLEYGDQRACDQCLPENNIAPRYDLSFTLL